MNIEQRTSMIFSLDRYKHAELFARMCEDMTTFQKIAKRHEGDIKLLLEGQEIYFGQIALLSKRILELEARERMRSPMFWASWLYSTAVAFFKGAS